MTRRLPRQVNVMAGPLTGPGRSGGVEVLPFPSSRRAVTAAVQSGRRIVPMHRRSGSRLRADRLVLR